MFFESQTKTTINLFHFQTPTIKYNRSKDLVTITSGSKEVQMTYLEFYLLTIYARMMFHSTDPLPLELGSTRFIFECKNGVTVRQRAGELLEAAKEYIPANYSAPDSYRWDKDRIHGSPSEHVYLMEGPLAWVPVLCLNATLPEGMTEEDALAYLHHQRDALLEGRALPEGTKDETHVRFVKNATPKFEGVGRRAIFEEPIKRAADLPEGGPLWRSLNQDS